MEEVTLATKDYVDGKSVSIDQTYNPLSENAQSGTAVAEVVEEKQDKFADIDTGSNDVDITINGITNDDAKVLFRNDYGQVLRITAPNPIIDSDVANKKYVDNNIAAETKRANKTFANALKGSVSGETVTMKDVSPVEHDMGVKVRGKNLIPYPYAETTKTLNGITFTDNGDGTITANGTATAQTDFVVSQKLTVPEGTYILSNYIDADKRVFLSVKSNDGSIKYFNQNAFSIKYGDVIQWVYIRIQSGTVCENTIFYPQLELGTTVTPYTTYISDITEVKLKKQGKNLFDYSVLEESNRITVNDRLTGEFTFNNVTNLPPIPISAKENTSYCISGYMKGVIEGQSVLCSAYYTDGSNTNFSAVTVLNSYVKFSGVTRADKTLSYIKFGAAGGIKVNTSFKSVQVELNTEATAYEPYKSAEYTPNADGTVEGVTSLYPTATLTTDTAGAIIDCEYSRDINKAFAELQQAVISMGGNI